MSQSTRGGDRRLHALERFQELELEQVRVERTRLDEEAEEQRQRITAHQGRLDAARSLEVDLITSAAGTSVDVLRHTRLYLQAEAQDILQQQQVLRKAEAAAESARLSVIRNFERLSATRRLRERRAEDSSTRLLRAQYKSFDDLAIVTKSNGK